MNIWIFLVVAAPFFIGFIISRGISSNATKALEPHHKALLVDFSAGQQKYTIVWLAIVILPVFIVPRAGFLIFAFVIIVNNWWVLKRLRVLEFPEAYKQKSLAASVVFTVGVLMSIAGFYYLLYLAR